MLHAQVESESTSPLQKIVRIVPRNNFNDGHKLQF